MLFHLFFKHTINNKTKNIQLILDKKITLPIL